MSVTFRVRSLIWFATGAVLAVIATTVILQTWRADAAPGDTDTTYVPIKPCRLFDYRQPPNKVGPRSSPLGAGDTYTQPVTGPNGNCNVPTNATAVAMNVTAVNPTAQSNLRVFPADINTVPIVSNLNFSAGQKPVANKVDVKLSPDGKIKLFNTAGSVSVIGDVVGYYTSSSLKSLQNQINAENTKIAALDAAQPFVVHASGEQQMFVGQYDTVVRSVTLTAPTDGTVTVTASHYVNEDEVLRIVSCSITTGSTIEGTHVFSWESAQYGPYATLAGVRAFEIQGGATVTYRLVCDNLGGLPGSGHYAIDSSMAAIFTPTP